MSTAGLVALMFTGGDGTFGSGNYVGVLLATFPIGLGQSCYFVTFAHVAKTWFPGCRGLAVGVAASGAAVGELHSFVCWCGGVRADVVGLQVGVSCR
jgi:hypothetical protein